jgi:hypothetical protein
MRWPRPRLTVRGMTLLVALVALGLFVAEEMADGLPPRFVVRGIPARMARLRPGMTWRQAADILGLDRSWLRGGLNDPQWSGSGNRQYLCMDYFVRPNRTVMVPARDGGVPTAVYGSSAMIRLCFFCDSPMDLRTDPSARLHWAALFVDARKTWVMPGSR